MDKHDIIKTKIKPFDPKTVRTVEDALFALQECSFQGRNLGIAFKILSKMVDEKRCMRVLTLAGDYYKAGMDEITCQLIERGVVNVIVSNGENISLAIINCLDHNDCLDLLHERISNAITQSFPGKRKIVIKPSELFSILGHELEKRTFIKIATEYKVPIFCASPSDSSLVFSLIKLREYEGINVILDEVGDINRFGDIIKKYDKTGTIILGGGVSRNWAQQIYPYIQNLELEKGNINKYKGYDFSIRFHSAVHHDGGLSGCTVSESISWGKYAPDSMHQSVWGDYTVYFPILITALFQRMDRLNIKLL
ncbi:MAG: deoxyhypusine synthase family protein, partial [Promethearchaeota archaeon]